MKSRSLFLALVSALVVALMGCGSSSWNANDVTVTVSPGTATTAANGTVALQAAVSGDCSGCVPSVGWFITEDEGPSDPDGSACNWFTNNGPPNASCPGGTIEETAGGLSNSSAVKYHGPATAGTYHVTAEWSLGGGLFGNLPPLVTKQATAVITVTQ